MIHIVNGEVLGSKIQGLPGDFIIWREMYDFGPLHSTWSNEKLIKKRASFFEEKLKIPSELFISSCLNQLKQLYDIPKDEEVVLWFEHDRYDQTMLMYILTQLVKNDCLNLSMVSVHCYPTITSFYGLSQLNFKELTELFNRRVKVTRLQVKEAVSGWCAYTSSNSEDIKKWITDQHHDLPYLLETFKRHLSYFPSSSTGLNEIEFLLLNTIAQKPCLFRDLFNQISPLLINDGISDLYTSVILSEFIRSEKALLKADGPLPKFGSDFHNPKLTITTYGENVLSRKANRLDLIGIDWWVGGVHLKKNHIT